MKNLIARSIVVSLLGILTVAAFAQDTPRITVNVPFSFRLEGQMYPAGNYLLTAINERVLLIQGEGVKHQMVLANAAARAASDTSANLKFHCYDNQCFAWRVMIPGHDGAYEIETSKAETELASRATGRYVALLAK